MGQQTQAIVRIEPAITIETDDPSERSAGVRPAIADERASVVEIPTHVLRVEAEGILKALTINISANL